MFSNAYQYFLAVARTGSFHKAAEELYVSQSAISKQIKALEEKLGYSLLQRNTRSVSLTQEGKIIYTALMECTEIMDNAAERIRRERLGHTLCGTLRMGILSNWDVNRFPSAYITGFLHENPGIELLLARLDQQELLERLKQNELDIIISPLRELENEFGVHCFSLGRYPFMLILSRNHPLACYDDIWDKLDGINLYTHHRERTSVSANLDQIGIHPNVVLVPNVDSKIAAAENGQGCTVVLSLSKAAADPGIRAYPLRGTTMEVVAAYKNENDSLIEAFLNHAAALKKAEGEGGEQNSF